MSSSPSEGILVLLRVAPAVVATPWRLGIGVMTPVPNTQVVVSDSPGEHPNPKWLLDYPYVQVMVRGDPQGYQAAFQKARDCFDRLLAIDPQVINGDRWDGITSLGNPSLIGVDENSCPMITANYRIIIEPAASALTHRLPL